MIDECVECGEYIPPDELVVDEGDRFHRECFDAIGACASRLVGGACERSTGDKDMSDKTGGPAFPCEQGHIPGGTWNQTFEQGMTLRDYFAAAALTGLCARSPDVPRMYATDAYIIADAMLAARSQP